MVACVLIELTKRVHTQAHDGLEVSRVTRETEFYLGGSPGSDTVVVVFSYHRPLRGARLQQFARGGLGAW